MTALEPREAYRLWAPTYSCETAVSHLDEELASAMSPALSGCRLLDAGCGTGRRLSHVGAAVAVGVDSSFEMLSAGAAMRVAVADLRALPFRQLSFEIVWCRLVLGHIRDPLPAYRELARVCCRGGYLLVSDFHAEAVAAGHRRTFRDQTGALREIEHHVHDHGAHTEMAARAGFALREQRDGCVGPSVEPFYIRAGREAAFRNDLGLPLVAAFLYQRDGSCAS